MILGEGTPFFDARNLGSALRGRLFSGGSASDSSVASDKNSRNHLNDLLDLSEQALNLLEGPDEVFKTLDEGLSQFRQKDIKLAVQRLRAVQERLDFTRNLLGQAAPEQKQAILSNVENIGREIGNIASQIGQIFSSNRTETSVQLVQGSFSQEFNAVAGNRNTAISVSEKLNVEFSFLQVSSYEETVEISRTDDGVKIERTVEETQIVVASLQAEREQTLSVNTGRDLSGLLETGEKLGNLLETFQNIVREFKGVIDDLLEGFGQEDLPRDILLETLESFSAIKQAFQASFEDLRLA